MSTKSDTPKSLDGLYLSDRDVEVVVGLLEEEITAWNDSQPLDGVSEVEHYTRLKRIRRQFVIAENMRAMGYDT